MSRRSYDGVCCASLCRLRRSLPLAALTATCGAHCRLRRSLLLAALTAACGAHCRLRRSLPLRRSLRSRRSLPLAALTAARDAHCRSWRSLPLAALSAARGATAARGAHCRSRRPLPLAGSLPLAALRRSLGARHARLVAVAAAATARSRSTAPRLSLWELSDGAVRGRGRCGSRRRPLLGGGWLGASRRHLRARALSTGRSARLARGMRVWWRWLLRRRLVRARRRRVCRSGN